MAFEKFIDAPGDKNSVHHLRDNMNIQFTGNTCKIPGDISALNYGETPYETEHQICRGDTEEDVVEKTKRADKQRLS